MFTKQEITILMYGILAQIYCNAIHLFLIDRNLVYFFTWESTKETELKEQLI